MLFIGGFLLYLFAFFYYSGFIKKGDFMNQTVEVAQEVGQNALASAQQSATWNMLLYCLFVMAVMYLFMMRPNRKRMAEYQKMLDSIKVGSRVLVAGMYGVVKKINEKTIDVEIAKGVVVEMNKNAVANVE